MLNPDPEFIEIATNGKCVTIKPHGFQDIIPSQDTANLQWVFEAYPHADLILTSGVFHISQTIESVGYQGTIRGAGTNETFLVGRGPAEGADHVFPMLNDSLKARLNPSGVPHLFWFHPGPAVIDSWQMNRVDLKLRDLSIRLDGVGPVISFNDTSLRTIWSLIVVTGAEAQFSDRNIDISHVRVSARNVAFIGATATYALDGMSRGNANVAAGLTVYGSKQWVTGTGLNGWKSNDLNGWKAIDQAPLNAQIEVRECQFRTLHQVGLSIESMFTHNTGTPYKFPRVPFPVAHLNIHRNVFCSIGGGAGVQPGTNILSSGHSGTLIQIVENKFEDIRATGITLLSSTTEKLPKAISTLMIERNTFSHAASHISQASIRLLDAGFVKSGHQEVSITENRFSAPVGFPKALIEIEMGVGVHIVENSFHGAAAAAISLGEKLYAIRTHVGHNNFEALDGPNVVMGPRAINTTVLE